MCLYCFCLNVNPIVLCLLHCFNPSCLQVYKEIKMFAALAWNDKAKSENDTENAVLRKDNVCYLLQFSLDWVPVTVNIYYDIKSSNLETACLGILYLRKTTHDPMTATCKWAFKNISRDISSLSIYVLYEENSCNKPRYQHWMTTRWIIHCSLIPTSQTGTWQNNHSWFHGLTWSCC